jgi:hypothetical protein
MDIFFTDPTDVPLPPDEIRIRSLRAEPWPDGRRVRIYLEIDPFQMRPNAEIRIFDKDKEEVASLNVIETIERKMEFTMHVRGGEPRGHFQVEALLFYAEPADPEAEAQAETPPVTRQKVIDRARASFSIESPGE